MTISYRFSLLFLSFSLVCLVSCGGDEFVPFPGTSSDAAEDVKSDKPPKDVYQEDVLADADAGKHDADAKAEDVIKPLDADADALVETAEDAQEEPDAPLEDVQPDELVQPDVQDAKPDEPVVSTLCQQNMPDAVDSYFIIGEAGIGNTIRIRISGWVDFPVISGVPDTTEAGWCWGDLGQTLVVCPIPVAGIVSGTYIFVRPGTSIGDGDPQKNPLCETGICNKTYTLCHGQFVVGAVNGNVKSPGTVVPDQVIKYYVLL
ncbi:MAG: hypothetical protein WCW31_02815 [Patescibacteria group bacterium]|jgi:hypothetical protein